MISEIKKTKADRHISFGGNTPTNEKRQMLKKCERCGKAIESAGKLCYNLTILKTRRVYYG